MHGAGLVNGVFAPTGLLLVELKTIYGYSTDIFVRTADSRKGTFIHIDTRGKYSEPAIKKHTADIQLAERVFIGIQEGLKFQKFGNIGKIKKISDIHHDYVIGPANDQGVFSNILGPPIKNLREICKNGLVYANYRHDILKGNLYEYCEYCGQD